MAQYKAAGLGNNAAFMQAFGNTATEVDTVTPAIALATGDTVDLLRIAGGTKLVTLHQFGGDFDVGAALTYNVGYRPVEPAIGPAANLTAFGTGLTTFQSAVANTAPTQLGVTPIDFNADVFIVMTVTAGAGGVTGTPSITTLSRGIARGIK